MDLNNYDTSVFFNWFRNKRVKEFEIYNELKVISQGYNKVLLIKLKQYLKDFLILEREKIETSFSKEQIKKQEDFLIREKKNVPKIGMLSGSTNKDSKIENLPQDQLERFNIEGLMYPDEFRSMYKLREIIDERINSNQVSIEVKKFPDYTKIFSSYRAFEMFGYLMSGIKKRYLKNDLAPISFIYRQMLKDNLIHNHIRDTEFREWLAQECNIIIGQTKTLEQSKTNDRLLLYDTSKKLFKLD